MRFFLLAMVLMFSAACSLQPWVAPYERAYLADPLMSLSRDPVSANYQRHVFEVRESARGAVTGEGGGCGCN